MQPKGLIVAVPLALAAALSLFIVSSDTASSLRIVVGVALLLMAFVSTRLSLYLLVFSMLLSPQFLVGGLTGGGGAAGRGITLRFDDFLLVLIFAIAQIPSGERASAPFEGAEGEPNTLGGYLIFMLAIVVGLLLTSGAVTIRLPLLLLLAAGAIGLMATGSRASFLAAGVVTLSVLGFLAPRKPILMAIVLLGTLSAPLWAPHQVKERVLYTFTQAQEEGQIRVGTLRIDTSTSERLRSWQQSFEIWQKCPIWGTGITGGHFVDAMYPRVLTETGLLGLVAFLVLIGSLVRMGIMSYRHATDQFSRGIALGFLLGFVGLLVHAVGANTFLIVRIMEPFWLFAALVVRGLLVETTRPLAIAQRVPSKLDPVAEGKPGRLVVSKAIRR